MALRLHLKKSNKKASDKNRQLKADDFDIVMFEMVEKERYKL